MSYDDELEEEGGGQKDTSEDGSEEVGIVVSCRNMFGRYCNRDI